jgi:hypothetical protein
MGYIPLRPDSASPRPRMEGFSACPGDEAVPSPEIGTVHSCWPSALTTLARSLRWGIVAPVPAMNLGMSVRTRRKGVPEDAHRGTCKPSSCSHSRRRPWPIRVSPEPGCHGFYTTTDFKEDVGDRGAQGLAIGGKGDATNGQAHSADGRGVAVQEFLAEFCGVGSLAP